MLTAEELARATGRSAECTRRLLRLGRLPGRKVGGAGSRFWLAYPEAIMVSNALPRAQRKRPQENPE